MTARSSTINGVDLTGKVVILKSEFYKGSDSERAFKCEGGFGCSPHTIGTAVVGHFLMDGEKCRVERFQVERLAEVHEIDAALGTAAQASKPKEQLRFEAFCDNKSSYAIRLFEPHTGGEGAAVALIKCDRLDSKDNDRGVKLAQRVCDMLNALSGAEKEALLSPEQRTTKRGAR